jgi:hypothetical protein
VCIFLNHTFLHSFSQNSSNFNFRITMNSAAALVGPSPRSLLLETHDLHRNRTKFSSSIICCSSRNQSFIPKLEPFNRSKIDRLAKDLPLLEKTEKDLLGAFLLCQVSFFFFIGFSIPFYLYFKF